ncbi:unnamed protein product [Closterium sp. Naga37s-1]|nr:unnamed protein product [Closterium sp. Naga37s-1]
MRQVQGQQHSGDLTQQDGLRHVLRESAPFPPCAGSEGAGAAEGGVGHVGGQQQRHHCVLCMDWRHVQPKGAHRCPVRLIAAPQCPLCRPSMPSLPPLNALFAAPQCPFCPFCLCFLNRRSDGPSLLLIAPPPVLSSPPFITASPFHWDAKLFSNADPPPNGAIPASITSLATLQYLDLTYIDLVGSIPSLATLTGFTHLTIGVDGSRLAGTLEGLAWLSSLTNLKTLGLEYLAAFTGDLSSLHILSHLGSLQQLDVSFLRAVEFPDWVTHLTNLQYLNVDTDDPRRQGLLKDDMSELTALTSL